MIELVAERMVAGGEALARDGDGVVVLVRGALPGERVLVDVMQERPTLRRAVVREVVTPSPARRSPPCPALARGCGGCPWQHIDPAVQPSMKVEIVRDALARIGKLPAAPVIPAPPLPAEGYRTTVRAAVDGNGRAAYRAESSHRLVTIEQCLIAHPLVDEVLRDGRFPGAAEVIVRVGVGTGEAMAYATDAAGRAVDVTATVPAGVRVGSDAVIHEVVDGHHLRVSARSFFQTRTDGAAALVAAVRRAAGDTAEPVAEPAAAAAGEAPGEAAGEAAAGRGLLVDAYAGVGLFAATLGGDRPVVAIEQAPSSVGDARHNLAGRAEVVRADVARWQPRPAELVVADPARRGLGRSAASVLAACGAPVLVLVSCDAASLGRDAALLAEHGYWLAGAEVVDLFPHTAHVEVVSRFEAVDHPPGASRRGGRTSARRRPTRGAHR